MQYYTDQEVLVNIDQQENFLADLWTGGGDFAFVARLNRAAQAWKDYPVPYGNLDLHQAEGVDLFFTPLTFDTDTRSNEAATMPTRILFADLDHGFVEAHLHILNPTYLWRTSPGNYQAIWTSETLLDRHLWSSVNQRLTYYMGADSGGWHASKVLRVPGSINYKRDGNKVSDLLVNEPGKRIPLKRLLSLPPVKAETEPVDYGPVPYSMVKVDWVNLFRKHWDIMPLGVRSRLMAPAARDRSLELFMLGRDLLKLGLNPSEVFHLLNGVQYNKFRSRPIILWRMVNE